MTFDSDGRDLAHQAERLAADKRDDDQRLAVAIANAVLLAIVFGPLVYVLGAVVREAFK